MNRLFALPAGVGLVAAFTADAHACDPLGETAHTIVAAMQATDQTPPNLPAIPPPVIHRGDGTQGTCTPSDCSDLGTISINAVATDDMTSPEKIGYRFTLATGTLPPGLTLPTTAVDPNRGDAVVLYWDADASGSFDCMLSVVAVDAAGNESAPQMVRVSDGSGGCAIARGHASRHALAAIAGLALLVAAYRRRRRDS
jgi:hypothetical protein